MPRTIPTLAAILAGLTIAAPAAPATRAEDHVDTYSSDLTAALAQERYYMGSGDPTPARNAARPKIPPDVTKALAQERYYMGSGDPTPARDAARPKTPSDVTRALAQERYYMGSADATSITPATAPEIRAVDPPITPSAAAEIRTDDGIIRLPLILATSGALIIGLATGSGLHLLHARRRQATRTAT